MSLRQEQQKSLDGGQTTNERVKNEKIDKITVERTTKSTNAEATCEILAQLNNPLPGKSLEYAGRVSHGDTPLRLRIEQRNCLHAVAWD